jgi:hypothetical protein
MLWGNQILPVAGWAMVPGALTFLFCLVGACKWVHDLPQGERGWRKRGIRQSNPFCDLLSAADCRGSENQEGQVSLPYTD